MAFTDSENSAKVGHRHAQLPNLTVRHSPHDAAKSFCLSSSLDVDLAIASRVGDHPRSRPTALDCESAHVDQHEATALRPPGLRSPCLRRGTAALRSFRGQNAFSAYDDGLFTPLGDLSALSSSEFTTLSHPAFSRHKVRVKQSHFCDESVRCASFHRLKPTTTSSDRRVAYSHAGPTRDT